MILQLEGGDCVYLVTSDQTMFVTVFGGLCRSLLCPGVIGIAFRRVPVLHTCSLAPRFPAHRRRA